MNVFGERQHPEKFIPMCIKKILKGETVSIHSNREKTKAGSRHYIHAKDVADALFFILQYNEERTIEDPYKMSKIEKYNIVGSQEIDNLELATTIADILGKGISYDMIDFHSSRPGHDLRYALSGEKMKNMGWEPGSLKNKLKQTVEWTVNNNRWLEV
jgi:dTDP-glucose 4,6-dehydratase